MGFAIFILVLIATVVLNVLLARICVVGKGQDGKYLGLASFASATVAVCYLVGLFATKYFVMSFANSIYFIFVDIMLLFLTSFIIRFTQFELKGWHKQLFDCLYYYFIFEAIVFLINPFKEICLSYVASSNPYVMYEFNPFLLYKLHLVYNYILIAVAIILLFYRVIKVPREYKITFLSVLLILVAVVCAESVFNYLPTKSPLGKLNFSICGYSLCVYALYWSHFIYRKHGLLNRLKNEMFENIGQGLVLFDYNNRLVVNNKNAEKLLPRVTFKDNLKTAEFYQQLGIEVDDRLAQDNYSMQCFGDENNQQPIRLDYRLALNREEIVIGRMFVLTDITQNIDLLTGFTNWDNFKKLAENKSDNHPSKMSVVVLDPNQLAITNSLYGYSEGNKLIKELAQLMTKYFPQNSFFIRGMEARLIAIINYLDYKEIDTLVQKIKEEYSKSFQYAINEVKAPEYDLLGTVIEATEAMTNKKLLDPEAKHSEVINSLIEALEQTDSDTKSHVARTQELGRMLGKRLGLSDFEQSKLDLLCILHDIGKIGVPLEILNKPGRLSDEEFGILKQHVEKGYQIALSTNELTSVAEMIKYHHERWDGKGYPDGLSRESIPYLSRIIAVVDAYDAMVHNRSYRKSLGVDFAKEELRKNAGKQFDPHIVQEFLAVLEDDVMVSHGHFAETNSVTVETTKINVEEEIATEKNIHPVNSAHYFLDKDLRIIKIDKRFTEMTGYNMEDIESLQLTQTMLIPEEDRVEYLLLINEQLANNQFAYVEHRLRRKDGQAIYVFCFGRLYYDSTVREQRSEIYTTDISDTYSMKAFVEKEEEKAQVRLSQWENMYRKDGLTGLLSHSAFMNDVEQRILEDDKRILFIMMDCDKFKQYNDTYGHIAGDKFLLIMSQSITKSLSENDLACRMGGDEFATALFFDKDIDEKYIYEKANQLFNKINLTIKSIEGGQGISMGATLSHLGGDTSKRLYADADKALYESKNSGRGKITII